MRRDYAQTVTPVDGSSIQANRNLQPLSPGTTPLQITKHPNEPKRLEISPEPILDPAAPILPTEGGTP